MEIEIGHGIYKVCGCERDGRVGLAILPAQEVHRVNDILDHDASPFLPTEDDVVIWFDNIEGARVLQDQVNVAVLRMNGYEVENTPPPASGEEG